MNIVLLGDRRRVLTRHPCAVGTTVWTPLQYYLCSGCPVGYGLQLARVYSRRTRTYEFIPVSLSFQVGNLNFIASTISIKIRNAFRDFSLHTTPRNILSLSSTQTARDSLPVGAGRLWRRCHRLVDPGGSRFKVNVAQQTRVHACAGARDVGVALSCLSYVYNSTF